MDIMSRELDQMAHWGSLPPPKVASRLELLFSTAVKSNQNDKGCLVFEDLSSHCDLERIPEDSHVGCGFIHRKYLEQFVGTNQCGRRTFAIEVRIFSPQLGIFMGVFMEKPGIHKIQLPPSMQKVGPSIVVSHDDEDDDKAAILINNIYPCNKHSQVPTTEENRRRPPAPRS